MKKLLIPLLCSLVAAWSCDFKSTYYVENAPDIVNVIDSRLINDQGVVYTITDKATTNLPNLEDGKRYYIVFDILNQQFDILLRNVTPVSIITPAILPDETEGLGSDPIKIQFAQGNRSYIDLGIAYPVAAGSNYARQLKFYYTLENADSQLNIHIFYDGNNENPTKMEEKDLKSEFSVFSIPISQWTKIQEVNISCDVLATDYSTGKYTIVHRTYTVGR